MTASSVCLRGHLGVPSPSEAHPTASRKVRSATQANECKHSEEPPFDRFGVNQHLSDRRRDTKGNKCSASKIDVTKFTFRWLPPSIPRNPFRKAVDEEREEPDAAAEKGVGRIHHSNGDHRGDEDQDGDRKVDREEKKANQTTIFAFIRTQVRIAWRICFDVGCAYANGSLDTVINFDFCGWREFTRG